MEGPSLVILCEELQQFEQKEILSITGNTKVEVGKYKGEILKKILSWGKHLILNFEKSSIRIHFLMFGSYRINETKDREPRLHLLFENGEINFYSCSVKIIEGNLKNVYKWKTDLMSDYWDEKYVLKLLKGKPETLICDALMDQDIFTGLGNIIKNEVLYRLKIHPERIVGDLKAIDLKYLVKEARHYCFQFYEWKKLFELKKHWLIFRKRKCPECMLPLTIRKTGLLQRVSYFCPNCQHY